MKKSQILINNIKILYRVQLDENLKTKKTKINYINSCINYLIPVCGDKVEKTIIIESLNIMPSKIFFSSFYFLNSKGKEFDRIK